MKCEYCGRGVKRNENCRGCGARAEPPEWERGEAFGYRDYVVWPLRNFLINAVDFYFYHGKHLEGIYRVYMMDIYDRPDYEEGCDIMDWVYEDWRASEENRVEEVIDGRIKLSHRMVR